MHLLLSERHCCKSACTSTVRNENASEIELFFSICWAVSAFSDHMLAYFMLPTTANFPSWMFTPHNRSYVPWFQFLWPSTVFHFGLGFQHFLVPPQTPPQLLLLLLWRLVPRWRLGVVRNFWRAYVFVWGVVRLFRFLNSVVQAFREVTLICWKVEQFL